MSDEEAHATSPPPPENSAAPPEPDYWQRQAEDAQRELAVRRALQTIDWFDPDDAYRELAQHAQRDSAGNWQINLPRSDGKTVALHPADAAKELAMRKPHWVKAKIFGGSGAGGNNASANAAGITYAELLKPHNQDKLRDYVHDRPEELERLRQAHFRK